MIVYKITNVLNGHAYVGATTLSLPRRFAYHLKKGRGACRAVAAALKEYGRENFKAEVLMEASSLDEMFLIERQMIQTHGTYVGGGSGYNLTFGGKGGAGTPASDGAKSAMSVARKHWLRTPQGIIAHRHACQKMVAASQSPEAAAKRTEAIRAAMLDQEKRDRIVRGLSAGTAASKKHTAQRMLVICGENHKQGPNLYTAPDGKESCRECKRRNTKAYNARRAVP